MNHMMNSTDVCTTDSSLNEELNNYVYKVGYIELSSYCKSLATSIQEIIHMLYERDLEKVGLYLNSIEFGLGFVLEDIENIDRGLIK